MFIIVLYSVSLLLSFISGGLAGFAEALSTSEYGEMATTVDAIDNLLSAVAGITLLVQGFKIRRMLREHFSGYLRLPVVFSDVALFFFNIYYLQYKINRLSSSPRDR